MSHERYISLDKRIPFYAVTLIVVTASLIGIVSYHIGAESLKARAVENMQDKSRVLYGQLRSSLAEMAHDTLFLQGTPPINGIIRSKKNNGTDPLDGSLEEVWKSRLATIFASMLQAKPDYIQVRYIGVGENGREIVRVDRMEEEIMRVAENQLQNKATHAYFQNTITLPVGEIYFSKVELNREFGAIVKPYQPVLRVSTPIYDPENGTVFGIIIINMDFAKVMQRLAAGLSAPSSLYIVNGEGDYLHHPDSSYGFGFEFGERKLVQEDFPVTEDFFHGRASLSDATYFLDDGLLMLTSAAKKMPGNPDLVMASYVPDSEFLTPLYEMRRTSIVLCILLSVLAVALALNFAKRIKNPINRIIHNIRRHQQGEELQDMPVERQDEIGDIARAFTQMSDEEENLKNRLQAILDSTVDGIMTIDDHGIVQSFNAACEHIFGYPADDVIGKNIRMLMPEPDKSQHDDYIKNYKRTGEAKIIGIGREVQGKRSNGSIFPIDLSISEVWLSDKRIFTGIIRDITQRKENEAALAEYMKDLERSNQELDDFAYIASHDLKEPLRGVHNHATFLMEDYEKMLPEEGTKRLQRMQFLSKRMEVLVNDLLYFSRIGRHAMAMKETDLNAVVEDIRDTMELFLSEHNAIIITPEPLPVIKCDTTRVTEVLRNLITNGVKYNDSKEKIIEIGTVKHSGASMAIYVKDNGRGIPKDMYEEVFRLFKRLQKSEEGSGAGLTFVKKIVERHKGRIWLESSLGEGTTFYFTLA
jgi:PAS domain S-box-containing protein